ncbi:MAG: hypothetical protein JWO12_3185 [Frankiales bacterium]|nr:hypothetical protein [Frankiales bacterium]
MFSAPRKALVVFLGAACVCTIITSPRADAAPVITAPSGLLVVMVPAGATLLGSGSTVMGNLSTTVLDGRSAATGYNVSVSTSGFDLVGAAVTTSPATHIPPGAAQVQETAVSLGSTSSSTATVTLPSASPVFRLTYALPVSLADLASSYTLALTVTIPAQAAPGRYTGTVTQTIG